MRLDSIGMFWQDIPIKKPEKPEKPEKLIPERFWEKEDYIPIYQLPGFNILSECEFYQSQTLFLDIECYPNYILVAFLDYKTDKVIYFEEPNNLIKKILDTKEIITFNGIKYDLVILSALLKGNSIDTIHALSNDIIGEELPTKEIRTKYKLPKLKCNHIDLFNLGYLGSSLKLIAGRLHSQNMVDLPFNSQTNLTPQQKEIIRNYCVNDLRNTRLMYDFLTKELLVRKEITMAYGIDVRSKSDQQIAETVLAKTLGNVRIPTLPSGTEYRYQKPGYVKFQTPLLNSVLEQVVDTRFVVSDYGNIGLPKQIRNLRIHIGNARYQMGIGGLHSREENRYYRSGNTIRLIDLDVTSYYPYIIINNQYSPVHLGWKFLKEYSEIVGKRVEAKRNGKKAEAEVLKIVVNGSFGKFGSKHSILYSPNLIIQTTLTGQLGLLMLIEAMELSGIEVISANTDGVTCLVKNNNLITFESIKKWWEKTAGYGLELTEYSQILIRDVNNYFAEKKDGLKAKGVFAKTGISKNPAGQIIYEAIIGYVSKGIPIENTIKYCQDLRKFVFVRRVKDGAVKGKDYLGKVIRWYWSNSEMGNIVYANNGNKVPDSNNSKPCMHADWNQFPSDVDYQRYINEAISLLEKIVK